MPSKLNAISTGTPSLKFTAAGDGALEIQNDGNTAITISNTGVATFAQPPLTAIPLFSGSNNRSISASTYVLSVLTPNIDTHGWFNAGNNRYTPQIAGYYRTTHLMTGTSATSSVGAIIVVARRNGSGLQSRVYRTPAATNMSGYVEAVIYMDGISDYFDWQAWVGATSPTVQSSVSVQLIRAGPE